MEYAYIYIDPFRYYSKVKTERKQDFFTYYIHAKREEKVAEKLAAEILAPARKRVA